MKNPLTGKHVLIILLSAFGVVFAVNGYFLYAAIHTHSGEQRGATYEAGLHYNATLAEQRAQEALHWTHKSEVLAGSRIAVTLADTSGSPVTGLAMEGWLERPAVQGTDRKLTFKEVDAGRYEAADASPDAGTWVLSFTAQKAGTGATPAIYRAKQRLWIAPAH
jgi:nitrogen fixation protein FixH